MLLALSALTTRAASTWNLTPENNIWNNKDNWTPMQVPKGKAETAEFSTSNMAQVSVTTVLTIGTVDFAAGASPFTITVRRGKSLSIASAVTNESGIVQNFVVSNSSAFIAFYRGANAGSMSQFTVNGSNLAGATGGLISFSDLTTASAGSFILNGATVASGGGGEVTFGVDSFASTASFTVNGATVAGGSPGLVSFADSSTADNAVFTVQGSTVSGASGGMVTFADKAKAQEAVVTNNGGSVDGALGGLTDFVSGFAGTATLVANAGTNGGAGGVIRFEEDSDGTGSTVQVFGNGQLDISTHFGPGVTIGSLAGDGDVALGANTLTLNGANGSFTFAGLMHDDGGLVKTGTDTVAFSSANTYAGGTLIDGGIFFAQNKTGSCTGTGPVVVDSGILAGPGTIAGAVTIGDGVATAYFAPSKGTTSTTTSTIQGALTFGADGSYSYKIKFGGNPTSDKVVAGGVTIDDGATFILQTAGTGAIAVGRVLTAISNTSADPITGTFSNLPDGGTLSANGQTFQASYEGGDGNDLTLTVTQ
jgi:autotransporter-associated beta strand protein